MTGTTHIRISVELKERIQSLRLPRESYTDTITRLIDGDDAGTDTGVTSEVNDRLTALEARVNNLESVDREQGNPEDQIVITENMLQAIHTRMHTLMEAGHSMQEISQQIGIPEGSLKKLTPGHSTPLKRIVRRQYDALLSL